MNIFTAYSVETDVNLAVQEIKQQIGNTQPKLILFFASSNYNPQEISGKMQEAFGNVMTFGCTTSGEIVTGKVLKNSVVAMALNSNIISDYKVLFASKIKEGNPVKDSFKLFEEHFGEKMMDMDPKKYVGIILADGLSGAEEKLMEKIGDLTNLTFIGGSAGDDLKFKETFVFAGGKAMTDSAILALLKPAAKFDFIKTQSFSELSSKLIATKVNEEKREVLEFNNKPAVQAYAEALGLKPEEIANSFMHNPIGLMVDQEPYVRSPQQVKGDSILFYCNIKQGMDFSLLESKDIISDTQKALDDKVKEMSGISGIINFHCILRALELEQKGLSGKYGEIFKDIPTIGFSTYGEEFIGHINQTSTILVFK